MLLHNMLMFMLIFTKKTFGTHLNFKIILKLKKKRELSAINSNSNKVKKKEDRYPNLAFNLKFKVYPKV